MWRGEVGAQTRHSQGSRKAGGVLGVRPSIRRAAQLLFVGKQGWGCPESFECRGGGLYLILEKIGIHGRKVTHVCVEGVVLIGWCFHFVFIKKRLR